MSGKGADCGLAKACGIKNIIHKTLLRDLGEVGTEAEFLEVLGGIVNTQLTQMLLDGGG